MSDDKHKVQLTFGLNMKISLIMSPRRSLCCKHENYVDYVDQFSAMSFRVRYDNFPKAITNPDRQLFAKSTLAEDVDIDFRIIATLFNYNIVVSRACAATHKKNRRVTVLRTSLSIILNPTKKSK